MMANRQPVSRSAVTVVPPQSHGSSTFARLPIGLVLACATMLCLMLAHAASARIAVVTTNDGRTLEGELVTQDTKEVVLLISNIRTPIARADIASIELRKSIREAYPERRAALKDDDLAGRFALADELYKAGELDLARKEAGDLKQRFPDSEKVNLLLRLVDEAIKIEREKNQSTTRPRQDRPDRPSNTRPDQNDDDQKPTYLTNDQINLIRLWELPSDLAKAKPNVIIKRETIDTLLEKYAQDPRTPKGIKDQRAFRAKPGWEQLQLIFQLSARELYGDVVVRRDPPVITEMKRSVYPAYIARYFRETFGKGQIPQVTLYGKRPGANDEIYTNFYILSQASHGGQEFINRQEPASSLLLQWGLPRASATHPAPDVDGWRPFFTGTDDANFQKYVKWIDSLYKNVNYGIQYNGPGNPDATESDDQAPANDQGQS